MPPPLITHIYTADPSAHVFEGKIYIYPSHDRDTGIQPNDNGDQYDMVDYHVFSIDSLEALEQMAATNTATTNSDPDPNTTTDPDATTSADNTNPRPAPAVTDHGPVLTLDDIPWASRQLWAPDAARNPRDGRYHLFFPARDKDGVFRVGVAVGERPEGPFVAEEGYIPGTYSIDPAVLVDDDDDDDNDGENGDGEEAKAKAYLYFGGLWGGQLQCFQGNTDGGPPTFDASWAGPQELSGEGVRALGPRVAQLGSDMKSLASPAREVLILDPETNLPLAADDHERRFFEAAWCHKRRDSSSGRGKYYLSWSTGDTHFLCWGVGKSAWGPFVYGGRLLGPVLGWTTHGSVVEFPVGGGRWWLFYHDCEVSGGVGHLRCIKVREVWYEGDGIVGERLVDLS